MKLTQEIPLCERRRNLNINEIARLGSNVKPVIQNENCSVLMLNDATGEGVMTVY